MTPALSIRRDPSEDRRDYKGRSYVGQGVCDVHGAVWMVQKGGAMCEWCALGQDQMDGLRGRRRA